MPILEFIQIDKRIRPIYYHPQFDGSSICTGESPISLRTITRVLKNMNYNSRYTSSINVLHPGKLNELALEKLRMKKLAMDRA